MCAAGQETSRLGWFKGTIALPQKPDGCRRPGGRQIGVVAEGVIDALPIKNSNNILMMLVMLVMIYYVIT